MPEPEEKAPETEDIEVVAHGGDGDDEELEPWCVFNGSEQL